MLAVVTILSQSLYRFSFRCVSDQRFAGHSTLCVKELLAGCSHKYSICWWTTLEALLDRSHFLLEIRKSLFHENIGEQSWNSHD